MVIISNIVIGSDEYEGDTTIRAESSRLLVHNVSTKKGEFKTFIFVVNKGSPIISKGTKVLLKERELNYLNWDEKITFEFNGKTPAIKTLKLEKDIKAITLFLCGKSWGKWFQDGLMKIWITNYAESGEITTWFMAEKRLDKVLSMIKKGDYLFVEFGHNDEKDKREKEGVFLNYADIIIIHILQKQK